MENTQSDKKIRRIRLLNMSSLLILAGLMYVPFSSYLKDALYLLGIVLYLVFLTWEYKTLPQFDANSPSTFYPFRVTYIEFENLIYPIIPLTALLNFHLIEGPNVIFDLIGLFLFLVSLLGYYRLQQQKGCYGIRLFEDKIFVFEGGGQSEYIQLSDIESASFLGENEDMLRIHLQNGSEPFEINVISIQKKYRHQFKEHLSKVCFWNKPTH